MIMPSIPRFGWIFSLVFSALALAAPAAAQPQKPVEKPQAEEQDPLKRPLTEKQKKEQEKRLKQELGQTYKRWLDEDVRWIIMDEEMTAFKQFSNDDERDQFIEQFWLRRDPTPDTIENEYKEEHYRRIAYAMAHGPRAHLHHLRAAGPDHGQSRRRALPQATGRRRRFDLDVPVRDLAVSLHRSHRAAGSGDRVRG
jgi:hypothetical protein